MNLFFVGSLRLLVKSLAGKSVYRLDSTKLIKDKLVNYLPLKALAVKNKTDNKKDLDCSVTDLIRHLDMETISEIESKYSLSTDNKAHIKLNVPLTVDTENGHAENVSELNGIAIPVSFELHQRAGHCSVLEHLVKNSETLPMQHRERILQIRRKLRGDKNIGNSKLETHQLLYLANLYNAYVSGYNSKREQIKQYDWLDQETLTTAEHRLSKYIPQEAEYEKELSCVMLGRKITGHLDIVDKDTIWELKCVRQLEPVHFIQLTVYAWLYEQRCGKIPILKVFNVLTEEIIKLSITGSLPELVSYLVVKRYGTKREVVTDEVFLDSLKHTPTDQGKETLVKTTTKSKCLIFQDSDSDSD